mmetsp:Transcript_63354/g.151160  ORF Transcript_63354/g.151160 Transcript_63354/m.151160 type:complete len:155 (-) Transcript_63354:1480-1944(-)
MCSKTSFCTGALQCNVLRSEGDRCPTCPRLPPFMSYFTSRGLLEVMPAVQRLHTQAAAMTMMIQRVGAKPSRRDGLVQLFPAQLVHWSPSGAANCDCGADQSPERCWDAARSEHARARPFRCTGCSTSIGAESFFHVAHHQNEGELEECGGDHS